MSRSGVRRGFTIIELMIAVAIVAIVLALAGPAFNDYIVTQRLKASNAALMTDLQFARSEALSHGKRVFVQFRAGTSTTMSCYTLYTDSVNVSDRCDCTQPPGSACTAAPTVRELRTVQLPLAQQVKLTIPAGQDNDFSFDPIAGGIFIAPSDFEPLPAGVFAVEMSVDATRKLKTIVSLAGRPRSCLPSGAKLSGGYAAC